MKIQSKEKEYQDRLQDVLKNINECDSECRGLGMVSTTRGEGYSQTTEWIIENLPLVAYGLERKTNYIFSNGLATGNEADDLKLKEWLYERKNLYGATNYSVLRDAVKDAEAYGESGIRWYDGNIYSYKQGYFGLIIAEENGIERIVAYYVHRKRKKVDANIKDEDWGTWQDWYDAVDYFDRKDLILMDASEFCLIRNDTSRLHGIPRLLMDKQRVELLLSVYERLNYDIDYDGPGRYLFWTNNGWTSDQKNEVSTTTEILKNSPSARTERAEKAKDEVRKLARDIKNAGSDSIGIVSEAISHDYLHIPRVTKATEFFGWLENEDDIVAQLIDMDRVLMGVGDVHGNVSMEKLIDDAMLNTIVPTREKYAIQISPFLTERLSVDKVYFDKYDLKQVQDANEEREKIALIVNRLSVAADKVQSEEVTLAIDEYVQVLRNSIRNDKGELISI